MSNGAHSTQDKLTPRGHPAQQRPSDTGRLLIVGSVAGVPVAQVIAESSLVDLYAQRSSLPVELVWADAESQCLAEPHRDIISYLKPLPSERADAYRQPWIAPTQTKPSPAPLPKEWRDALGRFQAKMASAELNSTVVHLIETFTRIGPVRPPHIELIDEEICFTWNKRDKYLDVTAFKDGHLEWYFRDRADESKPSIQGEGAALSAEAIKLLEQYARP